MYWNRFNLYFNSQAHLITKKPIKLNKKEFRSSGRSKKKNSKKKQPHKLNTSKRFSKPTPQKKYNPSKSDSNASFAEERKDCSTWVSTESLASSSIPSEKKELTRIFNAASI